MGCAVYLWLQGHGAVGAPRHGQETHWDDGNRHMDCLAIRLASAREAAEMRERKRSPVCTGSEKRMDYMYSYSVCPRRNDGNPLRHFTALPTTISYLYHGNTTVYRGNGCACPHHRREATSWCVLLTRVRRVKYRS